MVHGAASGTPAQHGHRPPDEIHPWALRLAALNRRRRPECGERFGAAHGTARQMPDRQAGHQILRLHAQHSAGRHGEDKIDRLAGQRSMTAPGSAKRQPEQSQRSRVVIASSIAPPFHSASPIRVASASSPTYQDERRVAQLDQRLDRDFDREQMLHPTLDHRAERGKAAASRASDRAPYRNDRCAHSNSAALSSLSTSISPVGRQSEHCDKRRNGGPLRRRVLRRLRAAILHGLSGAADGRTFPPRAAVYASSH